MDDFIAKIFHSLNNKNIRYCLLRGEDELSLPEERKEIDLFVAPQDLPTFAKTVSKLGFKSLASLGHAPHHFFVVFNKESSSWLKLDVVTEFVYGRPIRYLKADLESNFLSGTVLQNSVVTLAEEDEFLTLLLHCLLDKDTPQKKHLSRLQKLYHKVMKSDGSVERLDEILKQVTSLQISSADIMKAIDNEDRDFLKELARRLSRKLFWKNPISNSSRFFRNAVLRKLRSLLFLSRHPGVSVALLAPDGAGKSTLAENLTNDFYLRAKLIYMGTNYKASTVGLPFSGWLAERLKIVNKTNKRKSPYGLFIRGSNLANRLVEHWYRCLVAYFNLIKGRFVVFDRYIYDSWVNKPKRTSWNRLRQFLFEVTCPTPGLVILLDAPGVLLFERKGEHSPEWLEQQRQSYRALKNSIPNLHIISAEQNADQVRGEVTDLIWKSYGSQNGMHNLNGASG